jgi:hypothetical protein
MISNMARELSATIGMTIRAELDPDTARDLREALKTVQDFITSESPVDQRGLTVKTNNLCSTHRPTVRLGCLVLRRLVEWRLRAPSEGSKSAISAAHKLETLITGSAL